MEEKYPLMVIVREKLKEMNQDLTWLGQQTGRTERWFQNKPEMGKIEFQIIQKMSKALGFDFVADYYRFSGREDAPSKNPFMENETSEVKKKDKVMSMQMSLKIYFTTKY